MFASSGGHCRICPSQVGGLQGGPSAFHRVGGRAAAARRVSADGEAESQRGGGAESLA